MIKALLGWKGYAAVALVAAAAAGAGAWTAQGWRYGEKLASQDAGHAKVLEQLAHATVVSVQATRDIEHRRTAVVEKTRNDAIQLAAAARADAAARTAAERRLRDRIDQILADARSRDSALADGSPATGTALDMLAHVLGRAIGRAGQLAQYADEARIAGLTCERSYDGVRAER